MIKLKKIFTNDLSKVEACYGMTWLCRLCTLPVVVSIFRDEWPGERDELYCLRWCQKRQIPEDY